jgi:hypothetical protein
MRVFISFIFIFFVIFFCGPTSAQELSHYYTPSGFSMPMLESGEYAVSLGGSYYRGQSKTSALNPFYGNWDSDSRNYNVSFSGIIAISRQFLIRGELSYYPHQTTSDYRGHYVYVFPFDTSVNDYQHIDKQRASFQPQISLAYRPLLNLEISCTARYSTVITDLINLPADISDPVRVKGERQIFFFNVTYLGKL